jgi:hypothetical protein
MLIAVTQKNINAGLRANCSECPVALALQDHGFMDALVTGSLVAYAGDRPLTLSDDVINRINVFDFYGEMEPFTFELNLETA